HDGPRARSPCSGCSWTPYGTRLPRKSERWCSSCDLPRGAGFLLLVLVRDLFQKCPALVEAKSGVGEARPRGFVRFECLLVIELVDLTLTLHVRQFQRSGHARRRYPDEHERA